MGYASTQAWTDSQRSPVKDRDDYRKLPPRITPEEMVPVQPIVQANQVVQAGTDDEWQIRMGGAG
jgi:hypothetical protein